MAANENVLSAKERVEVELHDTLTRLTNLRKLLKQGPDVVKGRLGLTDEAYDLLKRQRFIMTDYVNVLRQRLDCWDI